MSRIIRSTVAGIALGLTLGSAAAFARPAARPPGREPAGTATRVWLLWNALFPGTPPEVRGGPTGPAATWAKAGSQMDPNGIGVAAVPFAPTLSGL